MHKKVAVFAFGLGLVLCAAPAGNAQSLTIGIKGGINVADVDQSLSDIASLDTQTRTGFVGGAFARLGLGGILAVQPELLYTQKGFAVEELGVSSELKVNYFQIPVLLVASLPTPGGIITPMIYGGGAVAFETTCDFSLSGAGISGEFGCDTPPDPGDALKRKETDFGLLFGAGVNVSLGGVVLSGEGRYDYGLVDLNDDPTESGEIKTRTWTLMAGIGIPIL